jgi:hypothetical protein
MIEEVAMPVNITLSDETFRRLENLAVGFDTPERVIERLLDVVELNGDTPTESRPNLEFIPDELTFKNELLTRKRAQVILYFKDGDRDVLHWNASRLRPKSNLRANLWSGFLRNWKEKGIVSAELSVLPKGLNTPGDETEQHIAIAAEIKWTINEVQDYLIRVDPVCSDDDHPYYLLATFAEETPDQLKRIAGLNNFNQKQLPLNLSHDSSDL